MIEECNVCEVFERKLRDVIDMHLWDVIARDYEEHKIQEHGESI